ncbi:hypothetical protein VPH35_115899 [Triticum aestivum]|uniref:Leucine-rich repeat-containing N-terminal plant-type domain-containing protein n=1 Tax=Aegilops tauschii TaxID=37682 RepID=N1QUW8_AEGTA
MPRPPRTHGNATEDDAKCLRGVKRDLKDPEGHLSSWTSNTSAGVVCDFSRDLLLEPAGVAHPCRLPLRLRPPGQNPARAPIPFVVNLDLSSNGLIGPLPSELANCRFLISLKLSDTAFSGQIPASLTRLAAQQLYAFDPECHLLP